MIKPLRVRALFVAKRNTIRLLQFIVQSFTAVAGRLRSPFSTARFNIKAGYVHREKTRYFDDTSNQDEYQKEVYQRAAKIMAEGGLRHVIDIGCGSGFKLMRYLGAYDTLGLEVDSTYRYLIQKYPERKWMEIDSKGTFASLSSDVIICADVIEHVLHPDQLLEQIQEIQGWKFLLISTPDRDLVRGTWSYGPPLNRYHIRIWNRSEFQLFLGNYFKIEENYITNKTQSTQLTICTPK